MSRYGVSAMEWVVPLKLQYTWLSGYAPLVRLSTCTSRTCCAVGMVLGSPHHESGGAPVPPPVPLVDGLGVGLGVGPPVVDTANSQSEYPHWVARAVPYMRMYRPVPETASVCVPPVPVVVL